MLVEFKRRFGDVWVDLTLADEIGGRRFVDVFLDTQPNRLGQDFRDALFRHTGGHPLFMVEILRTMQARGDLARETGAAGTWVQRSALHWETLPPRVEGVIEARLGRLAAHLRQVLAVASVEGEHFTAQTVARVQGVADREMLQTLSRELGPRGHRLVREDGETEVAGTGRFLSRYRFAHALFQEHLYQALSPGERRLLHGQVATALEETYAGHSKEIAAQLAGHFAEAGQRDKAIEYLVRAGNQARLAYAAEEAMIHYRRALAMLDGAAAAVNGAKPLGESYKQWRWEALKGLGQITYGLGEVAESEAYFRAAVTLAQEMGLAPREIVRLYHWLGESIWWQGRYDEMMRIGEEGLALLGDDTESVEVALMNQVIVGSEYENSKRLQELTHRTAGFLQRLPYVEELRAAHLHIMLVSAYYDKNVAAAIKWQKVLERKAEQTHDLVALQEMHAWAGRILAAQGDLRGAVVRHQRALELCTRIGDSRVKSWSLRDMAQAYLSLGDLQKAEARACEALSVAAAVGNRFNMAEARWHIGQIFLCQGASEEAVAALQNAAEPVNDSIIYRFGETHALGRAYLANGDRGAAIQKFQEFLAQAAPERMSEYPLELASALSGLEEALADPEVFRDFCLRLRQGHPQKNGSPFVQWFLEPTRSRCFSSLVFDGFVEPRSSACAQSPDWVWHDPFGDCSYKVQNGLQINAANGRDLWHINLSAPRVLRPVPQEGDFAVQTVCRPVAGEGPAIGGLLLWQDHENYLRLDRGRWGAKEIAFQGCLSNEDVVVGRGRLDVGYPGPGAQCQGSTTPSQARSAGETRLLPGRKAPGQDEGSGRVFLRLERSGAQVAALCSADGVRWFTVGSVAFPVEDSLQVGVHAIGAIDRTIYHGAYADGTAIRFESFQLWQADH